MYYRRPKRKGVYNYFTPFLIILIIFGAVFFGWRALNNFFIDGNRNTSNEKVFLSINSGSAKAMTVGKSEWQNAPDKIYLYRGEKIKTGADGRLTLTFFDQSTMRLDTDSEVAFASLQKKNETNSIQVELSNGNLWSKVSRITNPDSSFLISTDIISIDANSAEFAISYPGTVYVMDGNVKVNIKDGTKILKTFTVGVGQQFIANKTDVESIKKGESAKIIYAISDTFKGTNWYKWNTEKNTNTSESDSTDDTAASATDSTTTATDTTSLSTASTTSDSATATATASTSKDMVIIGKSAAFTAPALVTNKSAITINGMLDSKNIKTIYVNGEKATVKSLNGNSKYDKAWTASSISLKTEGKNTIKIEAEDLTGLKTSKSISITYDKTPPTAPAITKPAMKDGEVFELTDVVQAIEGTVDKDTYYVIVNDYQLQGYKPGSTTFLYYAKTAIGNLKAGKNEYKIYAKDKAGNLSTPVTITLTLDQKIINKDKEKTSTDTSSTTSTTDKAVVAKATSSGGVAITAPNNGKNLTTSKTEFEIKGTVPKETAKVMVNDYTLSLFKSGDTTFSYKAYASMKSLTIGQKNTYTAKAYDKNGKLLGSASITIDVESGESGAPKITIPSSTGSYTTTLDTIVIGGTVGKWVTHIYVNNKRLESYIPGSEKWSTSITLTNGKNTFSIRAEKSGTNVGTDSIEVNYKP